MVVRLCGQVVAQVQHRCMHQRVPKLSHIAEISDNFMKNFLSGSLPKLSVDEMREKKRKNFFPTFYFDSLKKKN